jgi:hypothetical protein
MAESLEHGIERQSLDWRDDGRMEGDDPPPL